MATEWADVEVLDVQRTGPNATNSPEVRLLCMYQGTLFGVAGGGFGLVDGANKIGALAHACMVKGVSLHLGANFPWSTLGAPTAGPWAIITTKDYGSGSRRIVGASAFGSSLGELP